MADVVGGVVRQRAEREGVLVDVVRFAQQRFHEVAGADVVHQVAEKVVPERIVAKVLNHRSAVRVRARPKNLVGRGPRKAPDKERTKSGVP